MRPQSGEKLCHSWIICALSFRVQLCVNLFVTILWSWFGPSTVNPNTLTTSLTFQKSSNLESSSRLPRAFLNRGCPIQVAVTWRSLKLLWLVFCHCRRSLRWVCHQASCWTIRSWDRHVSVGKWCRSFSRKVRTLERFRRAVIAHRHYA